MCIYIYIYPPPGHRPDGGVYLMLLPLRRLYSTVEIPEGFLGAQTQDHCGSQRYRCGAPRLQILSNFLTSSWDPNFLDFGGNLVQLAYDFGVRIRPKSSQEGFTFQANLHHIANDLFYHFWKRLGSIFGRFWVSSWKPS